MRFPYVAAGFHKACFWRTSLYKPPPQRTHSRRRMCILRQINRLYRCAKLDSVVVETCNIMSTQSKTNSYTIHVGTIMSIDVVCGLENLQQKGCRSGISCYAGCSQGWAYCNVTILIHSTRRPHQLPTTQWHIPCNGHALTDIMHAEWAGNAG